MRVPLNIFLQRENVLGNEHLFQKAWNEFKMLDGMKVSEMNDRQKALVLIFTKRTIDEGGVIKRAVHQIAIHTLAYLKVTDSVGITAKIYKVNIIEDIECKLEQTIFPKSEAPFICSILNLDKGFVPLEYHNGKKQYRIYYHKKQFMVSVRDPDDTKLPYASVDYPNDNYAEVYKQVILKAKKLPVSTSDTTCTQPVWAAIYALADRVGDHLIAKPNSGVEFNIPIDSILPLNKKYSEVPLEGSIGFESVVTTYHIAEAISQWAFRIATNQATDNDLDAQSVQCPVFKATCKKVYLDVPKIETRECTNSRSFPSHSLSLIMDEYLNIN
ncbi:hypothetical protein [Proteus phage PM135]|uniref:Uncharacterized protein n=1 Tax=Proteus phage PM135 TaxID=2048008 RepID=A0A2H4PRP6_9CAUD|nr:hypothetical protein FDJ15_gp092 [Proteus phage PM135]ATW69975.1 hypothetical protein [Proteus phage PM135]UXY92305.1 hypothetical protein [Proteus phage RP7]